MNIHVSLVALKQLRWKELVLRFCLGGAITATAGLIAMKFGPVIGGLFLAFPAILPASLTLVEKHEVQKKRTKGMSGRLRGRQAAAAEAAGATLGSVGLVVFGCILWQFAPNHAPWLVVGSATAIWALVALGLWLIRKPVHLFIQRVSARSVERPPLKPRE
jgi:Protein of unknown function (DUF3147)